MNHGLQRGERTDVPASRPSHITEAQADEIRREPIVLIDELARILKTSTRTLRKQLRAGTFYIPELPKVDRRHRWSRERVYEATATTTIESHRATATERAKRHAEQSPRLTAVGRGHTR